eukprot:4774651-Prymnesium_polylepis.2
MRTAPRGESVESVQEEYATPRAQSGAQRNRVQVKEGRSTAPNRPAEGAHTGAAGGTSFGWASSGEGGGGGREGLRLGGDAAAPLVGPLVGRRLLGFGALARGEAQLNLVAEAARARHTPR